jgi:hypothetical protein
MADDTTKHGTDTASNSGISRKEFVEALVCCLAAPVTSKQTICCRESNKGTQERATNGATGWYFLAPRTFLSLFFFSLRCFRDALGFSYSPA